MLVVSDPARRRSLAEAFERRALAVVETTDRDLPRTVERGAIDVILVETNRPGEDPFDVCRRLYALRAPPVILILRDPDEVDRVAGLEIGADDCVAHSTSARELLARIRALARRCSIQRELERPTHAAVFAFSDWSLCVTTRSLRGSGDRIAHLAATEATLLRAFVEHPGEVLSRERLRALVGASCDTDGGRLVDWRVSRLRSRLERCGAGGDLIRTVNRLGYVWTADVQTS